jgi:hypothetical protein
MDESQAIFQIPGSKAPLKKELTEDEIIKKNEQMLKRKMHAKRMLEEEKRQTIEKILNVYINYLILYLSLKGGWKKTSRKTKKIK